MIIPKFIRHWLFALVASAAFAQDPEVTEIEGGKTVTMTVTADGNPPPTFIWFKDAVQFADGPTVVIPAFTLANVGIYYAEAVNEAGKATSQKVSLLLKPIPEVPPVIASHPEGGRIIEGVASFTLKVVATGFPEPTYLWSKNGVAIAGSTSAELQLTSITRNDSAYYTVAVTNPLGTVNSERATLDVLYPPTFIIQPAPTITQAAGTTVILRGTAQGNPTPAYAWTKETLAIPGAVTDTLTLSNIQPVNTGTYALIAQNEAGATASNDSFVAVGLKPVITTALNSSYTVRFKGSVTLSVVATGGNLTYAWYRGSEKLTATGPSITLRSVTPAATGSYTVVVTNTYGSVSSATRLTVLK